MPDFNRQQKIILTIGASLIILGAGFLLLQIAGVNAAGRWAPLIAGAIALTLAVITRLPGFTILGSLLIFGGGGLLVYLVISESGTEELAGAIFLLFVSAGFLSAPVLSCFIDRRKLLWPLLPGAAGLLAGVLLLI